jgi:hypothetical protein
MEETNYTLVGVVLPLFPNISDLVVPDRAITDTLLYRTVHDQKIYPTIADAHQIPDQIASS